VRMNYPLTDATRRVLTGNIPKIAPYMQVCNQHLYGILYEHQTDPFAKQKRIYTAAVQAGAPVYYWDNVLKAIRTRYEANKPKKSDAECLAEKINQDAKTTQRIVTAMADGRIDKYEAVAILAAIDKEREALRRVERRLHFVVNLAA